ncbi:Helicase-like protein nhl, related [Neospora caninum Liverpool]|uniref:Helicase-like protein nhl, related n=1 Tax=Neospora caninum (strain Liverpool) TaxID=572307 RepID=F0VRR0_NEOCL|nr:Helicase-like protein nhl, related [Neospora caninum Liverpool]CBZ56408.1 Helicase-like protein nhl, related [Neospora caninum Liverpool]|eukprot:XP_003886433.1 Helicase-like protein nhl, related [Neospora caninum Liverpool]
MKALSPRASHDPLPVSAADGEQRPPTAIPRSFSPRSSSFAASSGAPRAQPSPAPCASASSWPPASTPSSDSFISSFAHPTSSSLHSLRSALSFSSAASVPETAIAVSRSVPVSRCDESSVGREKPASVFCGSALASVPGAPRDLPQRQLPATPSPSNLSSSLPASSPPASSLPASSLPASSLPSSRLPSSSFASSSLSAAKDSAPLKSTFAPSRSRPAPNTSPPSVACASLCSSSFSSSLQSTQERPPANSSCHLWPSTPAGVPPSSAPSSSLSSTPGSVGGHAFLSRHALSESDHAKKVNGGEAEKGDTRDGRDQRGNGRLFMCTRGQAADVETSRERWEDTEGERQSETLEKSSPLASLYANAKRKREKEENEEETSPRTEENRQESDTGETMETCEAEKLLPPHSKIFGRLSAEQRRVVLAPAHANLCVIAGPGSGKTTAITARIIRLLLEGEGPILALTFTKRGAEELRERVLDGLSSTLAEMRALREARDPSSSDAPSLSKRTAEKRANHAQQQSGASIFHTPIQRTNEGSAFPHGFPSCRAASPFPPAWHLAKRDSWAPVARYASSTAPPVASPFPASASFSGVSPPAASALPLFHDLAERVFVGTFHKFGSLVLRRYGRAVGVPSSFLVATGSRQSHFAREVLEAFKAREEAREEATLQSTAAPGRAEETRRQGAGLSNLEAAFHQVRRSHLVRMQRELVERQRDRAHRRGGASNPHGRGDETSETGEPDLALLDEAALDAEADDFLDFLTDEEDEDGVSGGHDARPVGDGSRATGKSDLWAPRASHGGGRGRPKRAKVTWKEVDVFLRLVRKCKFSEAFLETVKAENAQLYGLTRHYASLLRQQNPPLLDCTDLVLLTLTLLERHPNIRRELAAAYPIVFVDEFQDTSLPQFKVIKALAAGRREEEERERESRVGWHGDSTHQAVTRERRQGDAPLDYAGTPERPQTHARKRGSVTVVGDDDQSIYGFRGIDAKVRGSPKKYG